MTVVASASRIQILVGLRLAIAAIFLLSWLPKNLQQDLATHARAFQRPFRERHGTILVGLGWRDGKSYAWKHIVIV
jgi:hypothetical protein